LILKNSYTNEPKGQKLHERKDKERNEIMLMEVECNFVYLI